MHALRPFLSLALVPAALAASPRPPKSWIDADTGHRVVRLTDEPGSGSLYFNINAYTPDGKRMVYTTRDHGIGVIDLATFKAHIVVPGSAAGGGPGGIVVGHKTNTVFYNKEAADPLYEEFWATDLDTGASRKLATLPRRGGIASVNADETLAAGSYIVGDGEDFAGRHSAKGAAGPAKMEVAANKGRMMAERLAARLPMVIFVLDLATGKSRPLVASTDWLDHLQFSPTDPTLLMYAHQGAWNQVDKLWVVRTTDGSEVREIGRRIMQMEGIGHQWWDRTDDIWYDLHFPLGGDVSYVAGWNLATGERTWYRYQPEMASIHFNRSPDGTLFCGDGGREAGGQWIYLFHPHLIPDNHSKGHDLIRPGYFVAEKLVNLGRTAIHGPHDYRLEPNVSFTPDQKWVIFRSNMFGPSYAFAVEVAKAGAPAPAP
ncbi:MAG TPA: oligogalacturonate lyase family protein [Opitutaceae bacterium]|nr:oligogalacturonate lyase family protein [Opitutaceae bacterium]